MDFFLWLALPIPFILIFGTRWLYREFTSSRRMVAQEEALWERYLQGDITYEQYERQTEGAKA
ncbi:MAG: hypothetical protein EXR67_00520 [Dehalococcoidia bacterium]|nr:hypothetical protein [Dehalococcoidia bacterium]